MKPRVQGDLGELSALQWLAWRGAAVAYPVTSSPDWDLIADFDGRLLRVQVKTGTRRQKTGWAVAICTRGGNQSWSGITKRFDPARCDYLFVHVGDGRRWFIPSGAIVATTAIVVGNAKYGEYEVERGPPLPHDVAAERLLNSGADAPGGCPSGQRDLAVNETATPTQVRILLPPSSVAGGG